jgi:hypothetical protein
MGKAEQKCGRSRHTSVWSKYVKRQAARAWRRWAKRDPENAPINIRGVIQGWSD